MFLRLFVVVAVFGVGLALPQTVSIPPVDASPLPVDTGVAAPDGAGGRGQVLISIQLTLVAEGYTSQAQLFEECGMFEAIRNKTVTIIALPNSVIDEYKQKFGADISKLTEFAKQLILWDLNTKLQLFQKGLSMSRDVLNFLNQTLVPRSFSNGQCVLSGGKIVRPDMRAINGLIQGVDTFVRSVPKTIAQILTDIGGLVKTLLDTIKTIGLSIYNELEDATKKNTFLVPPIEDIPAMLSLTNLPNLANTIKSKYILVGSHTANDLAQMSNVTSAAGNVLAIRQGSYPGDVDLGYINPATGATEWYITVEATASTGDAYATNGVVQQSAK